MVADQRDIDREFAVAVDELLGAVERIDEPEILPAVAHGGRVFLGRFLRKHRYFRCQAPQPGAEDVVGGAIGPRDGRIVGLVADVVGRCVDLENGLARHLDQPQDVGQERLRVTQGGWRSKRVSLTVGPVSYGPATAHDAAPSCQGNDDTAGTAARLDAHRYRLPRHGRHGARPALRQPVLAGGTATALGRRARPDPRRGARRAAAAVQRETRHAGVVLHRPLERGARLRHSRR